MEEDTEKKKSAKPAFVLTVLLVLSVGSIGVLAHSWKNDLVVQDIRVDGNSIVGSAEIIARAAIAKGEILFEVDLYAVQKRVLENHFIRNATVRRDIPDRVAIIIEERVPIAALVLDNVHYIDGEGVVLPPVHSRSIFDVPVISGVLSAEHVVPGRKTTDTTMQEALNILIVAREIDDLVFRQISEVRVAGERDIILYTAEHGIPVLFGHGNTGPKLLKFASFWRNIVVHQGAQDLQYIDLRFEDQVVVCRFRENQRVQSTDRPRQKDPFSQEEYHG
ncbi:MAG: FtsQ-type POTRA domain-containing protein [Ignavibacteriae bacterium]|nr:FtsQ-type POTRA domain-containing protein [Ignavibacteriota bacterium]